MFYRRNAYPIVTLLLCACGASPSPMSGETSPDGSTSSPAATTDPVAADSTSSSSGDPPDASTTESGPITGSSSGGSSSSGGATVGLTDSDGGTTFFATDGSDSSATVGGFGCDPLLQTCANGMGCYPLDFTFACSTTEDPAALEGEPCDQHPDCAAGLLCADDGACRAYCELGYPCDAGQCEAYPDAPIGLEELGVCLP